MSDKVWSGVSVAFGEPGTAVAATGISKASTAVVSHSGADPSNGDFVLILSEGMEETNNRVFRVANVSAGVSFELEGVDSQEFGDFTSGTFAVCSFSNSLSVITGITQNGGTPIAVPNTTISQKIASEIVVGSEAVSYDLTLKHRPDLAGFSAFLAANLKQRCVKYTFSNDDVQVFYASVSSINAASGSEGALVTAPGAFKCLGEPFSYAA